MRIKVPPSGPLDAEVVFVGRDPGAIETLKGRPFCGPAGALLDKLLAAAGLNRADILITNVVPYQPRNNDWENHSQFDVGEGMRELDALLKAFPRKLIVCLGAQAFGAVTQRDPNAKVEITEIRGYVFDSLYGPALATLHPAFVLRQWHPNYALLGMDLVKAKRLLVSGFMNRETTTEIVRTFHDAEVVVDKCREAKRVAVDIETKGNYPACIAFSPSPNEGYCFPYEQRYIEGIRKILEGDVPLIFQNGQFDVTILQRQGFDIKAFDDTMLMWHALEPSLAGQRADAPGKKRTEKSLRFLASILTDEPFWKDYDFTSFDDQMTLCAKDARVTHEIAEKLVARLMV